MRVFDMSDKVFEHHMALTNEFGALVVRLLIDARKTEPDLENICQQLYDYMATRSSSALLLLQVTDYWGAEILMRPVIEATIKIIYICLCDEETRKQRIHEFIIDLPEINRLNHSERAKRTIAAAKGKGSIAIKGLIINSQEEDELRAKWPKKTRKLLEQKWTFSEMVREVDHAFSLSHQIQGPFLAGLAHSYGISSHLIHADETALDLVIDRQTRDPREKELLDYSHSVRIYSDIAAMALLSALALSTALNKRHDEFSKTFSLFINHQNEDEKIKELVERWRPLYANTVQF